MRLLVTSHCNRACDGCCNEQFDLNALPLFTTFKGFTEILLTGGEPMLYPDRIISIAVRARANSNPGTKIYMYTAKPKDIIPVLYYLDGICLTLHDQSDVDPFIILQQQMQDLPTLRLKSYRLNIFQGVDIKNIDPIWKVRNNIQWIKDCPIPQDEILMRWG